MFTEMMMSGSGGGSDKDLRLYFYSGSAETITCDAKIESLILYYYNVHAFQKNIAVLHPGETYNEPGGVDVLTLNSDGKTIVRTGSSKNYVFVAVME
jgi:hypothetical protein